MGFFWDALKELGSDLKEIGKDTVDEIILDPKKFFVDSAKEIAVGTANLAVGATKMVVDQTPNLVLKRLKEMDRLHREGNMSSEEKQVYFDQRSNAFKYEVKHLNRLIDKFIEDDVISEHIQKLEASQRRFKWFLDLPNFDMDEAGGIDIDEAKELLLNCEIRISNLQEEEKKKKIEAMERKQIPD